MILLAPILLLIATAHASITNCNTNSVFNVPSLAFWPDPAVIGANSTISFEYNVPAEVTQGTVKYTYTFNGIPFAPTTDDLCTQTTCPIAIGFHNQSTSSDFPNVSGKVTIKIEWFDESANNLLCAQISTRAA